MTTQTNQTSNDSAVLYNRTEEILRKKYNLPNTCIGPTASPKTSGFEVYIPKNPSLGLLDGLSKDLRALCEELSFGFSVNWQTQPYSIRMIRRRR